MEEIRLSHGGGGRLSRQLIENEIAPLLKNPLVDAMEDSAVFSVEQSRLAFTTDSYVVHPLFFPGGDIGRLAVCGTVNDLSMVGATPLYISLGLIIEEGFSLEDLRRILRSIRETAAEADVQVVTGDTKVVERGKGDGLYINTSGVGVIGQTLRPDISNVRPGDMVVINGPLGQHGMAVMTARRDLGFETQIPSDVRPLNHLVRAMMIQGPGVHALRDATRGGLVTVCHEIACQSGVGIELTETDIPVEDPVKGACEMLGYDPLYVANEGVLVAFIAPEALDRILKAMREREDGRRSTVIGRVTGTPQKRVVLRTSLGSHRLLDLLSGEQLPRIC